MEKIGSSVYSYAIWSKCDSWYGETEKWGLIEGLSFVHNNLTLENAIVPIALVTYLCHSHPLKRTCAIFTNEFCAVDPFGRRFGPLFFSCSFHLSDIGCHRKKSFGRCWWSFGLRFQILQKPSIIYFLCNFWVFCYWSTKIWSQGIRVNFRVQRSHAQKLLSLRHKNIT